jgi:osmotically-inducible protein OsmY
MKATFQKMRSFALIGAAVLALGACAGAGEKTGEVIDDSVITTKIRSSIIAEKGIDSTGISIETNKGHVLLTGAVKTASQRQRAEQIARTTAGVSSVSNRIEVR